MLAALRRLRPGVSLRGAAPAWSAAACRHRTLCAASTAPTRLADRALQPLHPSVPEERRRRQVEGAELQRWLARLDQSDGSSAREPRPELITLLDRLAHHKQSDLSWRLYTQLATRGAPLDRTEYVGLLRAVGSSSDPQLARRAQQVERDMTGAGLLPDDHAVDDDLACALMQSRANAGNFAGAAEVFEACEARADAGGGDDRISVSVVLAFVAACGRAAEPARAADVHARYFARTPRHHAPDAGEEWAQGALFSLGSVMTAHSRAGELEAARQAFDEAVRGGLEPNAVLVNSLLTGCRERGDVEAAIEVAMQYMLRPDAPLRATNVSLKLLLDVCVHKGELDRACHAYEHAQAAGLVTDRVNDSTLVRALARAGRAERAYRVYAAARERRGEPGNLLLLQELSQACYAASLEEKDEAVAAVWTERVIELYDDGRSHIAATAAGLRYAEGRRVGDRGAPTAGELESGALGQREEVASGSMTRLDLRKGYRRESTPQSDAARERLASAEELMRVASRLEERGACSEQQPSRGRGAPRAPARRRSPQSGSGRQPSRR